MTPLLLAAALAAPPPADRFGDPLPPGAVARLGSSRLRHPDRPLALAFLPDGKHLASGGTDGSVRVWAVADGREVRRLAVPDGTVTGLAVTADGRRLAAHFGDERVRLLAADTLRVLGAFPTPNLEALALSPDGALVAGVSLANKVILRETANGLDRLELPNGRAAAFAPDGSLVAVAGTGETVTVYDVLSGEPKHRVTHLCRDGVTALAFAPGGTHFATADAGPVARVRVWALGNPKPVAELVAEGPVAFLPDGRLVTRRDGAVAVWDPAVGKPLRTFGAGVNTFAVSADGKLMATAGDGARIAVWNREAGEELRPDGDGFGTVVGLFPAPGGLLAVGPRSVARWKLGDPLPAVVARPQGPVAAAAAADGVLVTAGPGRAAVWEKLPADGFTWRPARGIDFRGGAVSAAAVSPDRTRAVVATDEKRVTVFDPQTGGVVREWVAPGVPRAVAFLPGSGRLAAHGWDGFARVWDLDRSAPDGTPAEVWKGRVPRSLRSSVAASPDGRLVAFTSVVRVDVVEAATGRRQFALERKWEDGPFQSVAFSPDGRLLAVGTQGPRGAAVVWEVATRGVARRYAGGTGTVIKVAFLPDGRHLAAAGLDDTVLVWDLADRGGKAAPTDAELSAAWVALPRLDAAAGVAAVRTLAAGGGRGVAVIRDGLKDSAGTEAKVRQWVADLDAPAFAVREEATRQLTALGLLALPAVAAAERSPSAEVRQRAAAIVAAMARAGERVPDHALYADPLRRVRAVWALELIGGPDAAAVLESIRGAGGPAGEDAAAALKRMK